MTTSEFLFKKNLQDLQDKADETARQKEFVKSQERAAINLLYDKLSFLPDYGMSAEIYDPRDFAVKEGNYSLRVKHKDHAFLFCYYNTELGIYKAHRCSSSLQEYTIDQIIEQIAKYYFELKH